MKKHLVIFGMILFSGTIMSVNAARLHRTRVIHKAKPTAEVASTDTVCSQNLLEFAQSLLGTRYRSASSSPVYGFDCSGFVSYVFKNFNFEVPRSSCEFVNVGEKVALQDAKPGDVILFTGTSKRSRRVGHIGIVMSNDADTELTFIHSTSGKEHGVTITTMDDRYKHRFVRIVRLLKQNDELTAALPVPN